MEKISKETAGYLEAEERFNPNPARRCDNCIMFHNGHVCDLVKGDIKPNAWCRRWTSKTKDSS